MQFHIFQHSNPSFVFESFEASGYRDEKRSHILDALKLADAWGYSSSPWFDEPFVLGTEDGEEYWVVNPLTSEAWKDDVAKDMDFLSH